MAELDFSLLSGRVLCAVSGGADSVYLLYRCAEEGARRGFTACAAHYNHCLRGSESERDERFVVSLCERLGVECVTGRGDVAAYASRRGMGTEEAARELRYSFLEGAAERLGCGLIATAHNADDNVETMLLALARGSGTRGLAGIPPRRGNIVRPMLGITRREIEAWLESRGIEHVEDSTNASLEYSRNRIRALVIPALREINPGLAAAAGRASALLRADDECLEDMAGRFIAGRRELDCAGLCALSWSVASRVVRRMAPQALSLAHVEAVLAVARAGRGCVDVPGGRFFAENGLLRLGEPERVSLPEREVIIPGITEIPESGWTLSAEICESPREIHTSLNTFFFQCENICGTMYCTSRRPGDTLRQAGRGCTKKLKDLFAEAGIPASQRDALPVLRDAQGVLAVPGFGQAERAAARAGEKAVIIRARRRERDK